MNNPRQSEEHQNADNVNDDYDGNDDMGGDL